MSEITGLGMKEVIETLLKYADRKGQIPDIPNFFILANLSVILENAYGVRINWREIMEYWSVNAPVVREPLWLHVIKYLSNLNTKTEIITQVSKRKVLEK
ncbi:MAG: hypothetical protein QXT03_05625 [Desulfurococcaceae archaeon]